MLEENVSWCITGVYGPQIDLEKIAFMQEISDLKQHMMDQWLMLGDFNLIYRVEDKNNNRINIPMLNRFKNTIDNLQLAPLELFGRRFTWCNDQQNPTMTKIDHFLATAEWLEMFPRTDLQATLSTRRYVFRVLPRFLFRGVLGQYAGLFGKSSYSMGAADKHAERIAQTACQIAAHSKSSENLEESKVQQL